jgi:acetyl esterase
VSLLLLVPIALALAALAVSWTPQGFASLPTGFLIKLSALKNKAGPAPAGVSERRLAVKGDIALVDGSYDPADGVSREDIALSLDGKSVPARLYRPGKAEPIAILLFFHGGGFVLGGLDEQERLVRELCLKGRVLALSVGYRLAPEHRFPAAHDDALLAYRWTLDAISAARLPALPVFVAGDSAGGNLAASLCLMARKEGLAQPAGQMLLYPVCDVSRMDSPSYRAFGSGFILTKTEMEWFRDTYLSSPAERYDTRVSPLLEPELSGLAPALVLTAGMDPLRDEGEAYADRLAAAGVRVTAKRFAGNAHGFAQMRRFVPAAGAALRELTRFMHERAEHP